MTIERCNYLWNSAMFRLTEEQIDLLKAGVRSGDALSCYRLGRYLVSVRPEVDSTDMAAELFAQATSGGVADAKAALAAAPAHPACSPAPSDPDSAAVVDSAAQDTAAVDSAAADTAAKADSVKA